jgi:5-methyltetrahydrofolate--homocysteine methyltransferase
MIQRQGLDEDGFRGREFASHPRQLKGCNDLLVLTQPALIEQIHRQYLDAGADIIETDSFNANAFSLADYGLEGLVERINRAAATVARRAADAAMAATHGRRCWVAGSMGPTSKSLSMAADLDAGADTSTTATFDALVATYTDQAYALIDGGVDALLVETVFDGLNAKAAVYACRRAMEKAMRRVPIMVSATLTESSRTLSGQTVEALVASVAHAEPLSVGLNCGFGTDGMVPYLDRLQPMPYAVSLYPNAGLPNALGEYEETPQTMAAKLRPLLRAGLINIVGGCCGTTPEHIAAIAAEVATAVPRSIPASTGGLTLAGLEAYTIDADGFTAIGERCNVAGSRKFLRLINQGSLDEAITIARKQVDDGAMVVDINMDDAMLDAPTEMGRFVSRIAVEPEVSRVPLMIDSSNPDAIMAGLKSAQGRPIVNSISLKGGEAQFLEMARTIHELGAAMVVMAFDEQGQAASYERKVEVCRRAYRLLTTEAGIPASDIIFDPNVLTVATGIDAHRRYAIDFIEAVRTIRRECPGAHCSGGVSNLSFALRGNNYVREAMHSLFLAHARKAGLDMAIINPSTAIAPDTIAPDLTEAIDDVLLDRRDDATDRLVDLAAAIMEAKSAAKGSVTQVATDTATASQRLEEMVVKGLTDGMETLLSEVLATVGSAMAVIEGPLMSGMNRVGELFGAGRMFLPQVVKTARAMKHAVAWLTPHIEAEKATAGGAAAKMVIATVKGDVHDIGKNIVSVIMNCNGFDVVDLGVMVPGEDIVDCAVAEKADFVALSGLITPSLNEMCHVAQLMEERGLKIPLLIGGATTSDVHTAVKIAPCYSGPVAYTRDAAMMPEVARRFMADKDAATDELRAHQEQLRMRHSGGNAIRLLSAAEARQRRYPYGDIATPAPLQCGMHTMQVSIAQARKAINKRAFLTAWGLPASAATATHAPTCTCGCHASTTPTATELLADAERALDRLSADGMTIAARVVLTAAASDDSDNIIYRDPTTGTITLLPTLRQQHADDVDGNHYRLSLSDYLMPVAADGSLPDHIGLFAVTCGHYIPSLVENYRAAGDEYHALLYQLLADRLVEAATEVLHRYVRTNLWGYSPDESAPEDGAPLRQYYQGIRPAVGYPSLPDQSLLRLTGATLNISELGIVLTENCAMSPAATTSGLMIGHHDAHYFVLGTIGADQRADYGRRRGFNVDELNRFVPQR